MRLCWTILESDHSNDTEQGQSTPYFAFVFWSLLAVKIYQFYRYLLQILIFVVIYKIIKYTKIKHTYQITQIFHWMVDELYIQLFYLDYIIYALHHIKQMPYFHQDLMLAIKKWKLLWTIFNNQLIIYFISK